MNSEDQFYFIAGPSAGSGIFLSFCLLLLPLTVLRAKVPSSTTSRRVWLISGLDFHKTSPITTEDGTECTMGRTVLSFDYHLVFTCITTFCAERATGMGYLVRHTSAVYSIAQR
jgi:hypothetical protein